MSVSLPSVEPTRKLRPIGRSEEEEEVCERRDLELNSQSLVGSSIKAENKFSIPTQSAENGNGNGN